MIFRIRNRMEIRSEWFGGACCKGSGRCEEERTMKMTITAKKMQIPQNFTEYAEKRLNSKLDKFFGEEADAKITMATHKNLIVIE